MKLLRKFRAFFRKEKLDAEMAEELQEHLERSTRANLAAGMSPNEARYAAQRQFGGVEQIKERVREQRSLPWLEDGLKDLRHAARGLRRNPGFATVAVLTLALGIGASTAMFSVLHTVTVQPLPYRSPGQLVRVWDTNAKRGLTDFPASVANFVSWQQEKQLLAGLAAWRYGSGTLLTAGVPERIEVGRITGNLLSLLGVTPLAGRDFLPEEDLSGGNRVVLISEEFWQQRFQRSPAALGQTLVIEGEARTIVGVAPAQLTALAATDVWEPMVAESGREARSLHWLRVVGRLKPGVSLGAAQREMDAIAARLAGEFPESNENWGVRLEAFQDWIVPVGVRKALLVLFGAVACVLLIAAANLTNLLLVRAVTRTREIAVRAALGAGRGRIARQFAAEAVLLVSLGAAAGWLLASWAVGLLRLWRLGNLPRLDELRLDGTALAFTFGVSLFTALVVSVLPAWQAARVDLQSAMKNGGGMGNPPRRRLVQSGLVVAQLALSSMLLIGAALLAQSFVRLQNAPLGFDARGVQLFRVSLPAGRYPAVRHQAGFYQALTGRVAALPGVSQVGVTSAVPFDAATYRMTTRVGGRGVALAAGETLSVERFNVGPDYFRALGIALHVGRFFDDRDDTAAPPVAMLNEAAARRLWPGENPIGKTVIWNSPFTVIGVVADVRNISFDRPAQPALYVSAQQQTLPTMTFAVRSTGETTGLHNAIRRELRALDAELPMFGVRPLEELLKEAAARPRFNTGLLGAFAAAALLLAAIGLYGVTAYGVARRTREFGVRMALGAQRREVLWLVLGRGAKHAALGIGGGLLLSAGLTRVLGGMLHEVSATDPVTYAGIALLLTGVALVACWLPARRATKVDPMVALRAE